MAVKALILAGATTGVAVVTLVALNLIAPISHAEEKHTPGVSVDAVFGASISETGNSAPVAAPATLDVSMADTAAAEPASAFSAEPGVEVASLQDDIAATDVEDPAAETSAPSDGSNSGSCSTAEGLSGEPVVVKAVGYPGDAPAAEASDSESVSEPAAAAPTYQEQSYSGPMAEAAPAPKPKAKPKAPKVAPAEAKLAWWPAKTAGKLNLTYAGEASFTKAIVLLFDGAFDSAQSADDNIQVTTKSGQAVAGQWLVAKGNPQMLLFNVDPGLYQVSVGGGLTDKGGRGLGAASSGLVFVP